MTSELIEVPIPPDSPTVGRQIVELGLPRGALAVLAGRNEEFFVPRGATVLEARDSLLVLADQKSLAAVRALVGSIHQTTA